VRLLSACSIALLCVVVAAAPTRAAEVRAPTVALEARVGVGLALGVAPPRTIARLAPFTLGVLGEYRLWPAPWVSVYVTTFVEGVDRFAFGLGGGFRVRPTNGVFRAGIGLASYVAPYTFGGPTASGGACLAVGRAKATRLCADGELAAFVFGGDLPAGRVVVHLQLLLGVSFNAF
jgi:hypothetical protein